MKKGLSTGKPTKREAERIVACKEGRCMACIIQQEKTGNYCDNDGCDYHHMLMGGRRRGHRFGIALCAHHHRKVPLDGYRTTEMVCYFGPSLMDGSKAFHQAYGSDDDLLKLQDELIGWQDGV
jgi:hypothetical protein